MAKSARSKRVTPPRPPVRPNLGARLLAFFSQPIVGILGSIASIVGIALSVYLFAIARERPGLSFYVDPARAAIFRTDQASGLKVSYGGSQITADVTAVQVTVWNAGRKAIRQTEVLRPLILSIDHRSTLLDARIRRTSRPVVALTVSRPDAHSVSLGWRILEENDGGTIQLVFAGPETTPISASATIEGQEHLNRVELAASNQVPSTSPFYLVTVMLISIVQLSVFTRSIWRKGRVHPMDVVLILAAIGLFVFASSKFMAIGDIPTLLK